MSLPLYRETVAAMWASGADVAKVATTARDITDARRMLALLEERSGVPCELTMCMLAEQADGSA